MSEQVREIVVIGAGKPKIVQYRGLTMDLLIA